MALEVLKSLTWAASPLPEEDPDNGADSDVVVVDLDAAADVDATLPPSSSTSRPPSSSKKIPSVVEAASSAEGGEELAPLPKTKKVEKVSAKAAPLGAMEGLHPFLRLNTAGDDSTWRLSLCPRILCLCDPL